MSQDITFITILLSSGALLVAIWQARCNMRSQLISQRGLELQEQRERLAMLDTQYGQHITAHASTLEQLKIQVAILQEHVRTLREQGDHHARANS